MLLLVIGLVAVVIAVVVAAFLSMRRGKDDDAEPDGRLTVRDRVRGRGRSRDPHWDSDAADDRVPQRPAGRGSAARGRSGAERGYGGPDRDYEPAGYSQSAGYEPSPRGYGDRAPARGRGERAQQSWMSDAS